MSKILVQSGTDVVSLDEFASSKESSFKPWIENSDLLNFILDTASLCNPKSVYLCNGSDQEQETLCSELVQKGVFVPLDKRPGSFWCRSDPSDVARVEEATFICSEKKEDAGPTNNWKDPTEMKETLQSLFEGSMEGRTLYVIPFCMGPLGSPFSLIGIEITDSPYVVCNMKLMTRMGSSVLDKIGKDTQFIPCVHSVGAPLKEGKEDVVWPCNHKDKYIVHFPEEKSVFSFGSGYGGNALLGKKSVALRIASSIARKEGWLAEHMLIVGVTNPEGKKKYIAAAFPSQCGKTNLALLSSKLPGWKVECVGDDIAWIRPGKDGKLYAVNPEAGFFGVAPGTSYSSNTIAMETVSKNTIFTNVALTEDGDVWWEGMTAEVPEGLTDWKGQPYKEKPAAHPNSRFTVSISQCPILDPLYESPQGVPLDAILFGGRRASTLPLVLEAFSWQHGVFLGASVSSETTSAAAGVTGKLRHDPFAMLPFCGYNMGDYFSHWLEIEEKAPKRPLIFYVNWFRKDKEGKFIWPGFGENIRVLKWVFERTEGEESFYKTPIGNIPDNIDLSSLEGVELSSLLSFSKQEWEKEVLELQEYFTLFGDKLPEAFSMELQQLKSRVHEASSTEG